MNGPTHQLIGVTAAIGTGAIIGLPWRTLGVAAAGSYLAGKTPDQAERFVPPAIGVIILAASTYVGYRTGDPVSGLIPGVIFGVIVATRRLPHRGPLTHGVFVAVPLTVSTAAAGALASPYPLATALIIGLAGGYLAHLAADACTVSGLTAWPLRDKAGLTRHVWLLPRPLRHNMSRGRRRSPMRRRPRPRRIPPRAPR
jgi:membrane-bound metal-dependent hydrolase YbcI (DUF457 family)